MANAPSLTRKSPDMVKKLFHCPTCSQMHTIYFPKHFADNRARYPFTYVYIHKLKNTENIEDIEKDVLTTLYIDSNLNIRGVETIITEDDTNILSKEDSKEMISKLTNTILKMQKDYETLDTEYHDLLQKYHNLKTQ